jgi:hypothetical protein
VTSAYWIGESCIFDVESKFILFLSCANIGNILSWLNSPRYATVAQEELGVELKQCAKYKRVSYYSKLCQTKHWSYFGHKHICQILAWETQAKK